MSDPTTPTPSSGLAPVASLADPVGSSVSPASAALAASTGSPSSLPAATGTVRPSWVPDGAWTDKGFDLDAFGKIYETEIAPKVTQWATEVAKQAQRPQKLEDVVVAVPKDYKTPAGTEFKLDVASPAIPKFREFALEAGLSNDQVAKLTGIYADLASAPEAAFRAGLEAERQKLGPTAAQRVDAVSTFWRQLIGDSDAKFITQMMVTAAGVSAMEKAITKFATQGTARFTSVRDPAGTTPEGALSESDYQKLPVGQRLAYAKQFDQKQFMVQKRA